MKKIILLLFLCNSAFSQTFLKYYTSGNKERGIYFYKDQGYWLQSICLINIQGYQYLHINDMGDTLSSFYSRYNSLVKTSSDNFLFTHSTYPSAGIDTMYVSDMDTTGNETIRFRFYDSLNVSLQKVLQTSDSSYVLAGALDSVISSWTEIYKTDKYGNLIWKKSLLKNSICQQTINSLFEADNGDYILVSYHSCCCHTYPGALNVARIDTAGNILWIQSVSDDWSSFTDPLIKYGNDFILIGYQSFYKISSSGNILWTKPNNGGGVNYTGITPANNYGFYACGSINDSILKLIITKFDDLGDSLFSFVITGQDNITGEYIEQLQDGRLACVGDQYTGSGPTSTRSAFFLISDTLGNFSTSTNDMLSKNDLSLYPNPVDRYLKIQNAKPNTLAFIYDLQGRELMKVTIRSGEPVDVSMLQPGIYYLVAKGKDLSTFRFVKL